MFAESASLAVAVLAQETGGTEILWPIKNWTAGNFEIGYGDRKIYAHNIRISLRGDGYTTWGGSIWSDVREIDKATAIFLHFKESNSGSIIVQSEINQFWGCQKDVNVTWGAYLKSPMSKADFDRIQACSYTVYGQSRYPC